MPLFSRRNRKKAAFAAGFGVLVIGGFALLVVLPSIFRPSTPAITPAPSFLPIVREQAATLPYRGSNGRSFVDIVVQLRNPNARAGTSSYPVKMNIIGQDGQEILSHQETTHILPGALQYVVAVGLEIPPRETVGRVDVILPENPALQELPEAISLPSFSTFLRERTQQQIGGQIIENQTGLVKNTGTLDWQTVEVVAVGLTSDRRIVAAGKTFLGTLLAGEQREFTVQWPQPGEEIAQVVALPSTNIFSEENVVDILGDPGGLR